MSQISVKDMTNEQLLEIVNDEVSHETFHILQEVISEISERGFLPKYFGFFDENTESLHVLPVTCTNKQWEEWFEYDMREIGFVHGVECNFGVHDVNDLINDKYEVFGFTSYEVEGEKMQELFEVWKEKLIELGWTSEDSQWETKKLESGEE